MDSQAMERFLTTARDSGMPADQVERFVRAGYVPQPKQCLFHAAAREADREGGIVEIGLGGARGPGKSHAAMEQVVVDDCQREPGVKFLFLRSIKKSARESFEDLIGKTLRLTPHTFNRSDGVLTLPNGSRVFLGGFRNDGDIDKYIGIEYDGLLIEESTLISDAKMQMLYGSVRTSKPNWRPRKYHTTNPGGIGHARFKTRFVEPHRAGKEIDTRFIPSTYQDNAFLDAGYRKYLEELTGILGRAWRDGDWDIFAGQGFPDYSYERHVCAPFEIPANWPRWRSLDYGFVHPFVSHWFAKEPSTGRIFVYREYSGTLMTDRNQARAIKEMTPKDEHVSITYASPDMWARKTYQDIVTTAVDEYLAEGIVLTQADNHRVSGATKIHRLLQDLPDGKPGLLISSNCTELITVLPNLITDPKRPEDVIKVDANPETGDGGDDAYDSLRYGLTHVDTHPVLPHQDKAYNPLRGL